METSSSLPRPGLLVGLKRTIRAYLRRWVNGGSEILYWDDPRRPVHTQHPTFAPMRVLKSGDGEDEPVSVGAYSGIHYTVTVINGGQHHLDWVGILHAHEEHGAWVSPPDHVFSRGPVEIGSDCWIGFEALLTSGVRIGHGAVVAARAVVVKDVDAYSIVGGNPARHLRYRFDEDTRAALLRIAWWDWAPEKVADHRDLIHSPEVEEFVAGHDPALGPPRCQLCADAR